jgi:hypothetical protein
VSYLWQQHGLFFNLHNAGLPTQEHQRLNTDLPLKVSPLRQRSNPAGFEVHDVGR